jgi:glucosamine-6-phosphate deaminase
MRVVVCDNPGAAGEYGAAEVSARLNQVLAAGGRARLLLSTGQSQFETLRSLVRRPVDWARVDAFHLDEYLGIGPDHPASFRRYLKERLADLVPLSMHFVDPSSPTSLAELSTFVASAPMDVALVGIGENGHLAFNDPPADFETAEPYLEVELDARCRAQQLREGWFAELQDVPKRAVTMSVHEIMRSCDIVSVVPHEAKAPVIARLLADEAVTAELPATMLRRHERATVVLDRASAGLLPAELWNRCVVL